MHSVEGEFSTFFISLIIFLEFSLNILSSLAPDYKLVLEAFPLEMHLV